MRRTAWETEEYGVETRVIGAAETVAEIMPPAPAVPLPVKYDAMCKAIDACASFDEVKTIWYQAVSTRHGDREPIRQ